MYYIHLFSDLLVELTRSFVLNSVCSPLPHCFYCGVFNHVFTVCYKHSFIHILLYPKYSAHTYFSCLLAVSFKHSL